MACLRCGKTATDVFCEACKQEMTYYPVNPGTPISIPDREAYIAHKKANKPKRKATAEEKNVSLRKIVRFLLVMWLLTILAAAAFAALWIFF